MLNLALHLLPRDLFYPKGDSIEMKEIFDSNISLVDHSLSVRVVVNMDCMKNTLLGPQMVGKLVFLGMTRLIFLLSIRIIGKYQGKKKIAPY